MLGRMSMKILKIFHFSEDLVFHYTLLLDSVFKEMFQTFVHIVFHHSWIPW